MVILEAVSRHGAALLYAKIAERRPEPLIIALFRSSVQPSPASTTCPGDEHPNVPLIIWRRLHREMR